MVIEGPTDERLLVSTLGLDPRLLFPVGGKNNVLRCVQEVGSRSLSGVVCVADRDFDADEEEWSTSWWLIFYDDADVEAMLFESKALDRFLGEWASTAKLDRYGGISKVRSSAREHAIPMSSLRSANAMQSMGLVFSRLDIADMTDKKDGVIRIQSIVGRLTEISSVPRRDIEEALKADVPVCPHTNRPLARGRDLMAMLTAMLRQLIANLSKQQVTDDFVERSLRLASSEGDFDATPFKIRFEAAIQKAQAGHLPS